MDSREESGVRVYFIRYEPEIRMSASLSMRISVQFKTVNCTRSFSNRHSADNILKKL